MDSKRLEILSAFGYCPFFSSAFAALAAKQPGGDLAPGRVIFQSQEHYRLVGEHGEVAARPTGRLRRAAELPAVGDWVAFIPRADGPVPLVHVLPRRTRLSRKVAGEVHREQVVAANVDTVFVVMGLDGDYNLRRLERFGIWPAGAPSSWSAIRRCC